MDRPEHHPFESEVRAQHDDPFARIRIRIEAGSVGPLVVDDGELVAGDFGHVTYWKFDERKVLEVDDEAALVVVVGVA